MKIKHHLAEAINYVRQACNFQSLWGTQKQKLRSRKSQDQTVTVRIRSPYGFTKNIHYAWKISLVSLAYLCRYWNDLSEYELQAVS